jgi:hypothetical protein
MVYHMLAVFDRGAFHAQGPAGCKFRVTQIYMQTSRLFSWHSRSSDIEHCDAHTVPSYELHFEPPSRPALAWSACNRLVWHVLSCAALVLLQRPLVHLRASSHTSLPTSHISIQARRMRRNSRCCSCSCTRHLASVYTAWALLHCMQSLCRHLSTVYQMPVSTTLTLLNCGQQPPLQLP